MTIIALYKHFVSVSHYHFYCCFVVVSCGARVYFNVLLILQDPTQRAPLLVRISLPFLLTPIVLGLFCLLWNYYVCLLFLINQIVSMSPLSQRPSIDHECPINGQRVNCPGQGGIISIHKTMGDARAFSRRVRVKSAIPSRCWKVSFWLQESLLLSLLPSIHH